MYQGAITLGIKTLGLKTLSILAKLSQLASCVDMLGDVCHAEKHFLLLC